MNVSFAKDLKKYIIIAILFLLVSVVSVVSMLLSPVYCDINTCQVNYSDGIYVYAISQGNGFSPSSGTLLQPGDIVSATAHSSSGLPVKNLYLYNYNYQKISLLNGATYTISAADCGDVGHYGQISIMVEYGEAVPKYAVNFPSTLTVYAGGRAITSGTSVDKGTVVSINSTPPAGKTLNHLTANGASCSAYYTVNSTTNLNAVWDNLSYTLSSPAKVKVLKDGTVLPNGSTINYGDILTVSAVPDPGEMTSYLKINETSHSSGATYSVKGNVTITASFTPINYTVQIPSNVNVFRSESQLANGTIVHKGDILTITASPENGYQTSSLKVNEADHESGTNFTVGTKNVIVSAEFDFIDYTITIPENVSVARNGTSLSNGDVIHIGDDLTITASPENGYQTSSLKVNEADHESGTNFTVGTENVIVSAEFDFIDYTITIPENVSVTRNGTSLSNGDVIHIRDDLTVSAISEPGYKNTSLKVNEADHESGTNFTVGTENVVITTNYVPIDYTITIPENVSVTRNGTELSDGDIVHIGYILTIKTIAPKGKKLISFNVNGSDFISGNTFTVGTENISVAAIYVLEDYILTIPSYVNVSKDHTELENGSIVRMGDVLTITAIPEPGYKNTSLKVNEIDHISGKNYVVDAGNVVVSSEFDFIDYTITIPENVSVTRNGASLSNGDVIHIGDDLTVSAISEPGYKNTSLKVNEADHESGTNFTVGTENVVIVANYIPIDYTITIPENVSVTRNGTELSDGDVIHIRDDLIVSAIPDSGYKNTSLKVNEADHESGTNFTVGTENVIVSAEFDFIDYTTTIPENVSVTRNGASLSDGDIVHIGDVLTITAIPDDGYINTSLEVNGENFNSGEAFTVKAENVNITVSFDFENYIISIPSGVSVTRNGASLSDGDIVHIGDVLHIETVPEVGNTTDTVVINGSNYPNNTDYAVSAENVIIDVSFIPIEYVITIPENVSVTRNGEKLCDGDIIHINDQLTIVVLPPEGKSVSSLLINGEGIVGDTYIVMDSDVELSVSFDNIDYTITIPIGVEVIRAGSLLNDGDVVYFGDVLTITAVPLPGYVCDDISINGSNFVSGETYIVPSNNVDITADFILPGYTVSTPSKVEVYKNSEKLCDGDIVYTGDILTIVAVPDLGESTAFLSVNGVEISSGDIFIVKTDNISVEAEFDKIDYTITIPSKIEVIKNNSEMLSTGDVIHAGDILTINTVLFENEKTDLLTVNGNDFISGNEFVVGSEDVIINFEYKNVLGENEFDDIYILTKSDNVEVIRNGEILANGAIIYKNDILKVNIIIPDKTKFQGLSVNDSEFDSEQEIVVESDTDIMASFRNLNSSVLRIPANVYVYRDGEELHTGDIIYEEDDLKIFAESKTGDELAKLAVDDNVIKSGDIVTVPETGKADLFAAFKTSEKRVSIYVYDKNDNPVSDVKLKIRDSLKSFSDYEYTDDGSADFILPEGKYYVYIEEVPEGFVSDNNKISFTVTSDGKITGDTEIVLDFMEFNIQRIDSETKIPVAGVELSVCDSNNREIFSGYTDSNGIVKIPEATDTKYTVYEIASAPGYMTSEIPQVVVINETKKTFIQEMSKMPVISETIDIDTKENVTVLDEDLKEEPDDKDVYIDNTIPTGVNDKKSTISIVFIVLTLLAASFTGTVIYKKYKTE